MSQHASLPINERVNDGYFLSKNLPARQFGLIQSTMFSALEVLYCEIEKLQQQITQIAKAIADLSTSLPISLNSSVDDVSKKLELFDMNEFPPLQDSSSKTESSFREEINSDTEDLLRKCQVFVRNLPHSVWSDSIKSLCREIDAPSYSVKSIRLTGKSEVPPVILTFTTADEAAQFIRCLSISKRDGKFPDIFARPHYSPEEEKLFQKAWADACALNDASGKKEFIVRNFKLFKLEISGEWIRKNRPTRK